MKKRNIILIITISITAIALGTVLLLFVTNHNTAEPTASVVEDNPYEAPGFEEDEALDLNMNFIDTYKNKSNGTIGVISSFKTSVSDEEDLKSTAEEPTHPSEGYMLGDVNLDGEINILDATQLQKMIVGLVESTNESNTAADVNGDNSVDIMDATQIQKYCAGLIDSFVGSAPTTEPTNSVEDATSNTSSSTSNQGTAELPPKAPMQNGEWGVSVKNIR